MDVRTPVIESGSIAGDGVPLGLPARRPGPIRISFIVPCHNAAKTLDTALESLAAQTCPDWEAIIVDDGSDDHTLTVAGKWVARDSRIRVFRQARSGVSVARNAGIAVADNEWLCFLDSDDRLAPNYLSVMIGALRRRTDADAALCQAIHVESDGSARDSDNWSPGNRWFPCCAPFPVHACIVRRDLVQAVGGFDPALKTAEGWDLWFRLFRVGARFVPVRKRLASFIARPGSSSRNLVQSMRDGVTVLTRTFSEDPRLDPAAVPPTDRGFLEDALFLHLAGKAGIAIGQGDDPLDLIPLAGLWRSPALSAKQFADHLVSGVIFGAAAHPWSAREVWLTAGSRIAEMLADLEARSGAAGFADKVLNVAEAGLIERDDMGEPVSVGRTHGIPLVRGAPVRDMALPEGVARAVIQLDLGHGDGVFVELAATDGRISGRAVIREAARQQAAGILRRLFGRRPWRHPRLFLRFLFSVASSQPVECAVQLARVRPDCRRAVLVPFLRDAARRFVAGGAIVRGDASCAPVPVTTAARKAAPVAGLAPPWQLLTGRIPVLMYHSVADEGPPRLAQYRTTPESFAAQMQWLADNGYRTITPDDWFAAWQARRSFRDRVALITFDDGFADFRSNAWPVLDRYGFTATVFVVAGLVGGTTDWMSAYGATLPLMTWPEIREMSDRGIVFGSHSMNHRPLGGRDFGELLEEEREVGKRIAEATGRPVSTMAYPFGEYDPVVRQAMERAGYRTAFTTNPGLSNYRDWAMEIPRVEIRGSDTIEIFATRVSETAPPVPE